MTPHQALEAAISILEGQTQFAKICGGKVDQRYVNNWLRRDKKLPPEYALKIEAACIAKGSAIYAWQLCPKVFQKPKSEKSVAPQPIPNTAVA